MARKLEESQAPEGWKQESLSGICRKPISYGIVQTGEHVLNGTPCVRVVDLTKKELNPHEMITTSADINQSYQKTILEEGELMMALRGIVGLVRQVEPSLVGANLTRGIARLSPDTSLVDSNYLLWAMRSSQVRADLMRKVGGSALQEIALTSLRKVKVPIPPLPEQRKIAKILSTWDKAIATTEKLIAASKQQKKALMQQLLTGKKRLVNPETGRVFEGEWEEVRVKDVVKSLDAGVSVNSEDDKDITSEFKILKTSCVSLGVFDEKEAKSVNDSLEIGRLKEPVLDNAIIISRMNTPLLVGANAYVKCAPKNMFLPDRLWQIKANSGVVNVCWLGYWFSSSHARYVLRSNATGTSGSMKNITKPDVMSMKLLFPSLAEQQKIAQALTAADQEIEHLESKLAHFQQEKKALMQQLLTGKRRVKVDSEVEAV